MSEQEGKRRFDAIDLPEGLEEAVSQGLRRGRRKRNLRRWSGGMAAALALVFCAANIPLLYAQASEVPVLGPLVRVMRVGSGGAAVSGVTARVQPGKDRVYLAFSAPDGSSAPVPAFSTVQRETPRRVTLRLHGLAEGQKLTLVQTLEDQPAVQEAYPLAVTDPAQQGITIHLNPGWTCTAGAYEEILELRFLPGEIRPVEHYVLCSEPMSFGRELAELTEKLLWEGATQLRLEDGSYCVAVGEYPTKEQAERAREGLRRERGAELWIRCLQDEARSH